MNEGVLGPIHKARRIMIKLNARLMREGLCRATQIGADVMLWVKQAAYITAVLLVLLVLLIMALSSAEWDAKALQQFTVMCS